MGEVIRGVRFKKTGKLYYFNPGKYIFRIQKIGSIITALQNKKILIITMVMLVLLYLIEQKNMMKKAKRSKERAEYENEKKNSN